MSQIRRTASLALPALALIACALIAEAKTSVTAITSPTNGTRVRVGEVLPIAWTDMGTNLLNLHYQKGGTDTTWYSISSVVPPAPGQYNLWQMLPLPGSMRIRITTANGEVISYIYSEAFTVVQLNLTAPGFLTSWAANSTQNITWTNSSNAAAFVKLEYTLNGSDDTIPVWTTIRDSVPISPATFAWTVPNATTSFARVRIREVNSNTVIHRGDAFAITGGVSIKSPSAHNTPSYKLSGDAMRVDFTLPSSSHVRLDVLNTRGAVVNTLVNNPRTAGEHRVSLEPAKLPVGIYTLRLKVGSNEELRRIVVTR